MSADLGDLANLATAVGLLDGDGNPREGWLEDPERFLKRILADAGQRSALLETVDDLLGGADATTDAAGRKWVPLFEEGPVTVCVVVAPTDDERAVHIGLGVRVRRPAATGEVGVDGDAYVPLFAAAGNEPVTEPLLIGTAAAIVELSFTVSLPAGTAPGGIALSSVGLSARIPTADGDPILGLAIRGLRMPGAAASRDIVVDVDELADLDDTLLELVLGFVQASTDSLAPTDPAHGLAGALGLVDGDGVPDLPIAELLAEGPSALAPWLASCLEGGARDAWLEHLATLLSGSVTGSGAAATVSVPIGAGVEAVVDVTTSPGAAGLPVVTPRVSVEVTGAAGATLRLEVEPVSLDLATGAAIALPSLSALARIASGTAAPLLGPVPGPGGLQITVGAFEGGFALDADRRPAFVLRARNAVVGTTSYPTLDLTDGDALAGAAASAVQDAAASLLTALGPLGTAVGVLIGLADPPSGPAPRIDPARLLADPIGALRARWAALLASGPATVRSVLAVWQSSTAAAALRARAIAGDGAVANPYRIAVADGVDVLVTVNGTAVSVAVAATVATPLALGAQVEAHVRVAVLRAELSESSPSAEFGVGLIAVLALASVDGAPLRLVAEGFGLSIDSVGARIAWAPDTGARVDPWLDDPRLIVAGSERPLTGIGVGGGAALAFPPTLPDEPGAWTDAVWGSIEALTAAVIGAAARRRTAVAGAADPLATLLAAALELTGWSAGTLRSAWRLSLAELVADPRAELTRWARLVFGVEGAGSRLPETVVGLLGRLLGAPVMGGGVGGRPWALPLPGVMPSGGVDAAMSRLDFGLQVPALLLALGAPDVQRYGSRAPLPLINWRPGDEGLPSDLLAESLAADAEIDELLADALAGRGPLAEGFDGLVERWTGTDGVVALPDDLAPAGVTVHRPSELVHTARLDSAAVTGALGEVWESRGATPERLVLVGVIADGEPDLLPEAGAAGIAHEIDLTEAGATLEAFPIPPPAPPGQTVVRLGGKGSTGGSGFAGQVARLRRALSGLATAANPIVVVAGAGAGRVAVAAADGLPGIGAVVTVATPWTPLTLSDVDTAPAADGLRMLRTLLDLADSDVASELDGLSDEEREDLLVDDEDLALARGLVESLLARDERGDPLTELSAPDGAPPAGLEVHAVVGSCAPEAVQRALTAAVAGVLAGRSRRRAVAAALEATTAALGLHVPAGIGAAAAGLRAAVGLDADLLRWTEAGLAGPALKLRMRLSGDGRWLVGGPDPARAPGPRPLAVRAVTLELSVPLPTWGGAPGEAASLGRLVLHDAQAFGIRRARWVVDLSDSAPLVPEVQALLGEVSAQLGGQAQGTGSLPADPAIAGLVEAFEALGVLDPAGGFDATTIAGLLADPAAALHATLADATRTAGLASGLRAAVGDLRTDAGSTVELHAGAAVVVLDLGAGTAQVSAATDLGAAVHVGLDVAVGHGAVDLTGRLGAADLTGPGPPAAALEVTCHVPAGEAPSLAATATLRDSRGVRSVPLWPAGPGTRDDLVALLPDAVTATALQAALTALRSTLAGLDRDGGVDPVALVDALLSAAGLLRPAAADSAPPSVAWAFGLLSDPRGWLEQAAGDLTAAVPDLLDAVGALVPTGGAGAGAPGSLPITPGVTLTAVSAADQLQLLLDIDAAAFGGAPANLVLRVAAGVSISATGGARADVSVDVGAAGVGTVRVRVGPQAGGADPAVGVSVVLAPDSRPEIVVFPAARGLSGLADAATAGAVAALPALLTRLAAEDPADPAPATTPAAVAGRIVGRAGVALGLATGTPAVFSAEALSEFAADPATAFAARAGALTEAGLTLVVEAVEAAIGSGPTRSVTSEAGRVAITIGPVSRRVVVGWRPGTSGLDATVTVAGLAAIGALTGTVSVTPTAVQLVDVALGPATLPLGTVVLSPYARVAAGASLTAPIVEIGLGAGVTRRLLVRLTSAGISVLAVEGAAGAAVESDAPEAVAGAVVGVLVDVVGGVVLGVDAVQAALNAPLPNLGTSTASLLEGMVLESGAPLGLDPTLAGDLTEPLRLLRRLAVGVGNVADAMAAPLRIGGALDVRVTRDPGTQTLGLTVAVSGGELIVNPGSDVQVGLVTDAEWVDPDVDAGITLEAVRLPPAGDLEFAPGLVVGGVGVRVSRASGPLLEAGVTVAAVSVLGFGLVRSSGAGVELGGGARIAIEGLGIPLGGGGDGSNPVAQGVMPAAGAGDEAPAPRFSPAFALQKHPGRDVALSLRAGPGNGPWFLAIQREFGPIYVEQVGLAVGQDGSRITTVGLLVDGKVALFGLSASVDDLSLTYTVTGDTSPLDPSRWTVDVAGFAVTAETSGVTLAGGLRKFTPSEGGVEYLGMLLARLGVYGLTVYGGFGEIGPANDRYTSLFLFGAVNGPIGGPPAFFVTGIGGGFGANRGLVVPADLSQFGDYPLIKALDPAARAGDPFTELELARAVFPGERGQFWFAAGISFNSFALVDGVVVVAVAFGNGLELNILGLARMALPRPQFALVSIELALVARVSTREGVVLVQAQLTDNSWLLAPAVRLTGGFAFASWFGGPNRGQVVLTVGGYHPDFHRDGYPAVPRLGLAWRIGDFITVSGGAYFALTSEALMAGVKVEIHAQLGPAWAHLVFGADGIVYYDPFWLSVTIYASIDAGITIDLWFAEITISVHLAARLTVSGPPFHVVARFEIGPVGITFEIGPSETEPPPLSWTEFVAKYLEEAAPGKARTLTAVTGAGTVPPAGAASSGGAQSPDGQPDRPFRVVAEFTATVTSTTPLRTLVHGTTTDPLATSHTVSVAPMGAGGTATPAVTLRLRRRSAGTGGPDPSAPDRIGALGVKAKHDGAFPIGAWGAPQDPTNPKVPAGDVLTAPDQIEITASAVIPTGSPPIAYRQVETGKRRVLPLLPSVRASEVATVVAGSTALRGALDAAIADVGDAQATALTNAARLLAARGGRDALSVASWRAGLAAPVMLGSLGEGLGGPARAAEVILTTPPPPVPPEIRPPRVLSVLASAESRQLRTPFRTSVSDDLLKAVLDGVDGVRRIDAPSLASVSERLTPAVPARLVASAARARVKGQTVVPSGAVPVTSAGLPGAAAVAVRAAAPATLAALADRTGSLQGDGATIADGEVVVVEFPDADLDTEPKVRPELLCRAGRVRAVLLAPAGRVLADSLLVDGERLPVPPGTRTAVLLGGPPLDDQLAPWTVAGGWTAARPLPSVSDGLLVAAGAVVDVIGRVPYRGADPARAAWVVPAELLGRERATATTLAAPVRERGALAAFAVVLSGHGTDDVAIGLEGARQVGTPLVTTTASGVGALVVALSGTKRGRPVTVTLAADPGAPRRDLLGVVAAAGSVDTLRLAGSAAAAEWLAGALAGSELATVVPPPAAPGPDTSTIVWEVP